MKRLREAQHRLNRTALVLSGVVAIAVAAMAALLSGDVVDRFGRTLDGDEPVYNVEMRKLVADHHLTVKLVLAAVGLLLVGFGLAWLKRQIPPVARHPDIEVDNSTPVPGDNRVDGAALVAAVERDIAASPLVDRARVELLSGGDVVRVRLDVDETATVAPLLDDVVQPAIDRLATVAALDRSPDLVIELRPEQTHRERVR